MSKTRTFATVAKGASYLALALNQMLKLATNGARIAIDSFADRKRYNIELIVQGATIETKENQSGTQLSRIVRIMGEVGVEQAIITDVQKDKS
jgi:hypothetical protein|tara:strand:- start:605 stop:883 length:279 start_codon:yes stop_codon:yes gene_type:complete